ncbi:hypothetical protein PR003_g3065 [Phytophthora rubi]|uniref:Reverse transcriptase Ty1/copia-type domain-containing protein n=1 Tax=Phytophthora rubi TaxID=129364 RepID=A0A6A4G1V2_9STRA|nr:hypothetical protein PR003_g3065 [Phytophthora rubi]
MPSGVADDVEDAHEPVRQPAEHEMEDTEMEDATVDGDAIDMDVDTPAVHDAIVPTTSESLAVPERESHSASDPPQVEFRHSDAITDTIRHAALPPATSTCRSQQIVRATRRTMAPSSDQFESSIDSRMIVTQPGSEPEPENMIVFSGGSRRALYHSDTQPRLLPSSEVVQPTREIPLLTEGSHSFDRAPSDDDNYVSGNSRGDDEPDNKRPRTDDYEMAMAAMEVPRSYNEAMSSPASAKWKEAIRREIRSHVQNHTWDLLMRPRGVKVIGNRWIFALKYDENGNVTRYKARLVALGYLQTQGIDYTHTYSPVASMNTIRVFLAVCCQRHFLIRQFDIETAFLNGDLDEDVYMEPPEGVRVPVGMVCQLRRSLYGLKQAAAVWFTTIRAVFSKLEFSQCRADPCLFVRHDRDVRLPFTPTTSPRSVSLSTMDTPHAPSTSTYEPTSFVTTSRREASNWSMWPRKISWLTI